MKRILLFFFINVCICKAFKSVAQVDIQDSLALVDLFDSCGGANWIHNDNWLTQEPVSSWYGIEVNISTGRISLIGLGYNNLTGQIPESLGTVSQLKNLGLFFNHLTGSIPSSLGNLTELISLQLDSNNLSGTIPESIGNFSHLTQFSVNFNQLSGVIPASFSNLISLDNIQLNYNNFSGHIPDFLGSLPNLFYIGLIKNNFSGNIPASLENASKLQYLYLSSNHLSGRIPSSLSNLKNLTEFLADNNELSDSAPILNNTINYLTLFNNYFNFSGLEQIAAQFGNDSSGTGAIFNKYSPQALIHLTNNNRILSVSAGGTLANDTFHWYKNTVLYQTIVGDSTLMITTNGSYSVSVTNKIATQLTLYSDTINIDVLANSVFAFTATEQNNNAVLKWSASSDVTSDFFEIEKSIDAAYFTGIGKVIVKQSSVTNNYIFIDDKLNNSSCPQIVFYRLKIYDKNGNFTYSEIKSVKIKANFTVLIYPVPVTGILNILITIPKAETVTFEIINSQGKTVLSGNSQFLSGSSTYHMNVSLLTKGIYFLNIKINEKLTTFRFMK